MQYYQQNDNFSISAYYIQLCVDIHLETTIDCMLTFSLADNFIQISLCGSSSVLAGIAELNTKNRQPAKRILFVWLQITEQN